MPLAVLAESEGPTCSSQPMELMRSKKPCSTQPSRLWMYRSSQNLLARRRSLYNIQTSRSVLTSTSPASRTPATSAVDSSASKLPDNRRVR